MARTADAQLVLDLECAAVMARPRARRRWPQGLPPLPSFVSYRRRRTRCLRTWRLLRPALEAQLRDPVVVEAVGFEYRVCALGCVTYVFDQEARTIFIKAVEFDGSTQRVVEAFNLRKPLSSDAWMKCWLGSQWHRVAPLLRICDDDERAACRDWLLECIRCMVRQSGLMSRIRAALGQALCTDEGLCARAWRLPSMRGQAALNALHVEAVWRAEESLVRVAAMNEDILPLWWAAQQQRLIGPEDGLGPLKQCLKRECRLTEAGWRMLCQRGRRLIAAVRRFCDRTALVQETCNLANPVARFGHWPTDAM